MELLEFGLSLGGLSHDFKYCNLYVVISIRLSTKFEILEGVPDSVFLQNVSSFS